jgi:hypothetical protein
LTARLESGGNAGLMESEENKKPFPLAFAQTLEIAIERRFHTLPPHGCCWIRMTFTLCTPSDTSALRQQQL